MSKKIQSERREFLFTVTYTVGAVGVGAAIQLVFSNTFPKIDIKSDLLKLLTLSTVSMFEFFYLSFNILIMQLLYNI